MVRLYSWPSSEKLASSACAGTPTPTVPPSPLKAMSFIDARLRMRRSSMFRLAVTYGNCGPLTPKAIPQIIKTSSSQYNSHRSPAGGFLQVAVSEAPAHNGLKAQLLTCGCSRYSTKTSGPEQLLNCPVIRNKIIAREQRVWKNQARRTRAGSVLLARHAGNRQAEIAVVAMTAKADPNTSGSCGLTL